MSFQARLELDEDVATIRVSGELDGHAAGRLNDLVVEAAAGSPRRLVLLMQDLTYMSSAGLRSLVFAHQKMAGATEIVLVGTQPDVAETIRLTGFDHSIVMQESESTGA